MEPLKPSSIQKSKRRHALKEIDRKWKPRLEKGKNLSDALKKKQK